MKKTTIFTALVTALFFAILPSAYAKQDTTKLSIPSWFNRVFQPFQNTIKALTNSRTYAVKIDLGCYGN